MGADTDFNALYDELDVTADSEITQFRHAYRRRVASLHPDLQGTDAGLARLQQLNQSYARAVEFHRLHGRLPGAARVEGGPGPFDSATDVTGQPPVVAGKPRRARYSVLVASVGAMLLWLHETNPSGPLVIGMDAADVRAIQGEPSTVDATRWEYGPSWVEFRCNKVVDWYSAPAQPLQVDDDPAFGGKPEFPEPAFDC